MYLSGGARRQGDVGLYEVHGINYYVHKTYDWDNDPGALENAQHLRLALDRRGRDLSLPTARA
jgi:hypothetical protein